jgi:hypothetical protein
MIDGILLDRKIEIDYKFLKRFFVLLYFILFLVLIFPEARKVNNAILSINSVIIFISAFFLSSEQRVTYVIAPIVLSRAVFVQVLAQLSIFIYWGMYNAAAINRLPLVVHQIVFGYVFLFILSCMMGSKFKISFSPAAAIFSANLFIWFSPAVYYFHYALIVIALLAKTFITRTIDGEKRHIFNPSGFVSNIAAVTISMLEINYIHEYIYATQMGANYLWLPNFDLVVFSASCFSLWSPNMYLVAIGSIFTMWAAEVFSNQFFGVSFTTETPRASILLGIALLITDPATAPRSKMGQFLYGVGYTFSIFISFIILAYKGWQMYFVKVFFLIPLNFFAYKIDQFGKWLEESIISKLNFKYELSRLRLLVIYICLTSFVTVTLFGRRLPPFLLDFDHNLNPSASFFDAGRARASRMGLMGIVSPKRFYYMTRMILSGRAYRQIPYRSPLPINKDFDQFRDFTNDDSGK